MADKYEKLRKMRSDIERSRERIEKLNEDLEHKIENLRKAEAQQMLEDIYDLNLTPEMLGEYLEKYKNMIKNQTMANIKTEKTIDTVVKENKENDEQNKI